MRFIDQKGDTHSLQILVFLNLLQYPGKLLLGSDDDRVTVFKKLRKLISFSR